MVMCKLFNLVSIIIILLKVASSTKKIINKENQVLDSKIFYKLINRNKTNPIIQKILNCKNKNCSKYIFNNNKLLNFSLLKKRKLENINQCAKTDDIGIKNSLCIECNTEEGYYPLYYNYLDNKKYAKYFDCYQDIIEYFGFYFNWEINGFQQCYHSCQICFGRGDINNYALLIIIVRKKQI